MLNVMYGFNINVTGTSSVLWCEENTKHCLVLPYMQGFCYTSSTFCSLSFAYACTRSLGHQAIRCLILELFCGQICVLCGYGGGAMARAQKAVGFLKGLVKVWQEKVKSKERADIGSPDSVEFLEIGMLVDHSLADHRHFLEKHELSSCTVRGKGTSEPSEFDPSYRGCMQRLGKLVSTENLMACNTVSSGLLDSTVVQWVHMVCALWMPGTRCLNFGTMGVFDVSGVSQARRKLVKASVL